MSRLRVLYLYAGPRKKLYERHLRGEEPDTALVGLNHLFPYGIHADFLENRLTEFLRKISFNLTQLPVLWRARSYDVIFSGSGLLTLFLVKYLLKWKKPKWFIYNTYLSNLLKRNRQGIKAKLIRKAVASADGIICPSLSQHDYLAGEGFDQSRLFYIPYGIDVDFYLKNADRAKRPISEPYVFSAGRDMGRDYSTLIKAVTGEPMRLVIGALPRNFPGLKTFPPNVTVKYFPSVEMPSLFHHAAFVVIPSIPEEKLVGSDCSGQYVLLEAMASGKAVIITERSTRADHFEDGEDGLVVPPEDPEALKHAILELWSNPERARAMGERARTKTLERFTTKRFAEDFVRILL